jgi:hypothetical protein
VPLLFPVLCLFFIPPSSAECNANDLKRTKKTAYKDVGEAFCRFITDYVDSKVRELDKDAGDTPRNAEEEGG